MTDQLNAREASTPVDPDAESPTARTTTVVTEESTEAAGRAASAEALAEQATAAADAADPGTQDATLRGPWDRLVPEGPARTWVNWLSVAVSIYLLISAVNLIGGGFKAATGDQAQQLFEFASNPFVALMVGVLATAATQSSSTTTSITVGLAAGGLPLHIAIPIIMGANIGTTLTNTLVSIGMIGNKEDFRRAFAAATVHDFFNLIAVAILLPLELMTGYLERLSGALASVFTGATGVDTGRADVIGTATEPIENAMGALTSGIPAPWGGILMIAVGIALILFAISFVGKVLKVLMVGRARRVLHTAIGRGPVSGIASGTVVTALVQSSSTATSLMIPLAGSGTFTLRQVYPFTIGANIGTTVTALLAALGLSGANAGVGLQVALVHLLFNLSATVIIFGLPFLRPVPVRAAQWLANRSAEHKSFAAMWVLGVFVALPGLLIAGTLLF